MGLVDIYMRVIESGGAQVEGESEDAVYASNIELMSFRHLVEQQATEFAGTSGGASAGRAHFREMEIEKGFDSATPTLFRLVATGAAIESIEIVLRRAGGADPQEYMRYFFKNCMFTSIEHVGDGRVEDSLPTERVKFVYGKMHETYNKIDRETHTIVGSYMYGYTARANTEWDGES